MKKAKKRKVKGLNFKSKEAYKKWLAYGHMHIKGFGKTPMKVSIKGKNIKVNHAKNTQKSRKRRARKR